MKIDAYMPFYGAVFLATTRAYPNYVKWAYLSLIWVYWAEHCEGLTSNEKILRAYAECTDEQWPDVKEACFGEEGWFVAIGGRWHQKHTREIYEDSMAKRLAMSDAGKRGIQKRWAAERARKQAQNNQEQG